MRIASAIIFLTLAACQRDGVEQGTLEHTDSIEDQSRVQREVPQPRPVETTSSEVQQEPLDLTLPRDLVQHPGIEEERGEEPLLPDFFGGETKEKKVGVSGKILVEDDDVLDASAIQGAELTIETRLD